MYISENIHMKSHNIKLWKTFYKPISYQNSKITKGHVLHLKWTVGLMILDLRNGRIPSA